MSLVDRVKNIILKPHDEWPVIAAETETTSGLYSRYIAPLAAIPAVATFIGMTLIGYSMLGVSIKLGFGQGLTQMIIGFALALATVYVLALIIEALAPTFEGQKDRMAALKLAAYSSTPGTVAGILHIIPSLGVLVLLASLYGIYLLYTGLPRC
jgi:Yip1 domain